jgi:hypothetical protein
MGTVHHPTQAGALGFDRLASCKAACVSGGSGGSGKVERGVHTTFPSASPPSHPADGASAALARPNDLPGLGFRGHVRFCVVRSWLLLCVAAPLRPLAASNPTLRGRWLAGAASQGASAKPSHDRAPPGTERYSRAERRIRKAKRGTRSELSVSRGEWCASLRLRFRSLHLPMPVMGTQTHSSRRRSQPRCTPTRRRS